MRGQDLLKTLQLVLGYEAVAELATTAIRILITLLNSDYSHVKAYQKLENELVLHNSKATHEWLNYVDHTGWKQFFGRNKTAS